ncbi:hypothetical protein [Pedobacter ginsengisoli]|uniref:hypothetical protein n=1 Tax=Pedobacter ginsengisoli TaxID=363852 RepID=UPI00254DB4C9|nr:hypothetical protein [Pedobacter ginsengisoli]
MPSIAHFIAALSGCKKDGKKEEDKINFPITLFAEKATVVSDTKVYVKGGLLNDPEKNQELMWTYSRHFKLEQELQNAGEAFMLRSSHVSSKRRPY